MRHHHTIPIVRVQLIPHAIPFTQYALHQGQIRQNAPKSGAFTPALSEILVRWSQSTDKASACLQQEQALTAQLRQAREGRMLAARQARLDEIAFAGTAEAVAQNNPETLRSLGLLVQQARKGTAMTAPPTPGGLTVKPGSDPGTLHIAWQKSPGKRSYQVQISLDPATDASWVTQPPQAKRTLRLGDLRPGTGYLVRVRATGTGGSSAFSEAARGTAR